MVALVPIVHEADKELGCTIAVWDGDLASEDMQQQLIRLASDPDWPPGPHHLVDATTLGTVVVPDPELVELLYEGTNLVHEMRIAIVVRPDFLDAAPPRFDTASKAFDAAPFTDLDSACGYLGLSVPAIQSVLDQLREQLPESP
jgi:hypothetical protein